MEEEGDDEEEPEEEGKEDELSGVPFETESEAGHDDAMEVTEEDDASADEADTTVALHGNGEVDADDEDESDDQVVADKGDGGGPYEGDGVRIGLGRSSAAVSFVRQEEPVMPELEDGEGTPEVGQRRVPPFWYYEYSFFFLLRPLCPLESL